MHKRHHRHTFTRTALSRSLAAAGLGACVAAPAYAQSLEVAAADAEAGAGIETVVVTATRREESLQQVPIAVSVVSGEQLAQDNRNAVDAIAAKVPELNFRSQPSNKDSSLFIRGLGTVSTSPGVESSVSTVVDGVVYGSRGQATLDLIDLDRIEVLRGPQGTLFGKNASAGVLNIISQAPSEEASGYLDASYLGGGEVRTRARVSGALVPQVLRGSLTALYGNFDGNVRNVYNDDKVNGYNHVGARAKLEYTPDAALRATLSLDYVRSNDDGVSVVAKTSVRSYPSNTQTSYPAFADALSPVVASADNREINSDYKTRIDDDNGGVGLNIDWTIADYTLTSITAVRLWHNTQYQNGDQLSQVYQQYPGSVDRGDLHYQQTSQELRIASPRLGWFDYVAGAFYMHGKDDEIYQRWLTQCSTADTANANGLAACANDPDDNIENNGRATYGTRSDSYALFGEGKIHFSDTLRLITGLRWTHDELSYFHERTSTSATAVSGIRPSVAHHDGSTSDDGLTARVGPQWDISDNVTSYLTYSRGYKGPAYNVYFNQQQPLDTDPLDPETSNSYEAGLKSLWFDRRLQLNFAVFDARYSNFQANTYDTVNGAVVTRLINAGKVSSKGAELDVEVQPIRDLRLSAAAAYLNARIDEFNCPVGAASSCDVDGKPLPYAPDWKTNVRADYALALGGPWNLQLSTDYNWQDRTNYDIAQSPEAVQGAYGIWNASVAIENRAQGWRAALLAKNIADTSYSSFRGAGGAYVTRIVPRDDARYFGVNLHKDF
ncbi:TonB-dependent receptor [Solimonas soli]|uniref:TonB-dependent receptor n=1 Tax=Solimonas soli TaxID=413479 RepID=UPI0004B677A9|nr:TonB-dependent receptor [Solimonas soli]